MGPGRQRAASGRVGERRGEHAASSDFAPLVIRRCSAVNRSLSNDDGPPIGGERPLPDWQPIADDRAASAGSEQHMLERNRVCRAAAGVESDPADDTMVGRPHRLLEGDLIRVLRRRDDAIVCWAALACVPNAKATQTITSAELCISGFHREMWIAG